MKTKYVDAHCHIQFEQYEKDGDEIIERMFKNGVVGIVVGVDLKSSQMAVALAEKHEHLFASVGLHPNRTKQEDFHIRNYLELAKHPKVVAIGECGLDYLRPIDVNDEVKCRQKAMFNDQIILAAETDKPLIIHARPSTGTVDAYNDLIEILKLAKIENPNLRGDIHFFVGGIEEAEAFISLDFTISFTAVITFTRDYDEVIRAIPLANILSETDAPYVPPEGRRGTRNDPLAVVDVVVKIAEIRNEPLEAIRAALLANAERLFALPALS